MIISFEDLPAIRQRHSAQSIGFRGGCYDLFHEGHVEGIEFTKSLVDILVIGVRPNVRVKERKGTTRPFRSEISRLAVVNALRAVDYALVMPYRDDEAGASSTMRVINALRPNVFVAPGPGTKDHPNDAAIQALGTEIVFDMTPKIASSTGIVRTILQAYGHQGPESV